MLKILLSPPIAFVIFFGVGLLIYWLGRAMAPKTNMTHEKGTPYACGEDAPMPQAQMSYKLFFSLAIFFTVMHVAALVVTTLPSGPIAALGIVYLVIIMLSVFALVTR
jgi:NADH:ubiquinone oxidoreductase subunit 3 (subunit A)